MTQQFSGNTYISPPPDFIDSQDRTLDPDTAAIFCVGCPFKGVVDQKRTNDLVNGSTNTTTFNNVGQQNGVVRKTIYVCTSRKQKIKDKYLQEHSTLGFGFCPFLEQKLQLLPNANDGG